MAVYSPFDAIDLTTVVQEGRQVFNSTKLDKNKSADLLTKIMFLIYQGHTIQSIEATELFFSVTKLFQSHDIILRRLVYLVVKELSPFAENTMMVMNMLNQDMNKKGDMARANSIRVMCEMIPAPLLVQVERHIKEAVVDRNPCIATAALVSGIMLLQYNGGDFVKRWTNEVTEAVSSKHVMVSYHALALNYELKRHDRLAMRKLVLGCIKNPAMKGFHGCCLLIRYVRDLIQDMHSHSEEIPPALMEYLSGCLRHKHDAVILEAARAICSLTWLSSKELSPATVVLQIFLSHSRTVARFSAVRTLASLANSHPAIVSPCNMDLEGLITDPNRSISTCAITTLLNTGTESSVDRLLKQIASYMSDLSDEFRVTVVTAVKRLASKYPSKVQVLMNFLSNCLRDEGGLAYKTAVVDVIVKLIQEFPAARESGLLHLCEFIEDCEHVTLSVTILHLLAVEGPSTSAPSRFIRHIYNRVVLETAPVRAAAVSALAKFALALPTLRPRIVMLLKRCLSDEEDEVRDRAIFYLSSLDVEPEAFGRQNEEISELVYGCASLPIPLTVIERSLNEYSSAGDAWTLDDVVILPGEAEVPEETEKDSTDAVGSFDTALPSQPAAKSENPAGVSNAVHVAAMKGLLQSSPELAQFGQWCYSSEFSALTEEEVEFTVSVRKHITSGGLILEVRVVNTVEDCVLRDVMPEVDLSTLYEDESDVEAVVVPATLVQYDHPSSAFIAIAREEGVYPLGCCPTKLSFVMCDVDTVSGDADEEGYSDSYEVEDIVLNASDFIQSASMEDWADQWEVLEGKSESSQVYSFPPHKFKSLVLAVQSLLNGLGLAACEGTGEPPAKVRTHSVCMSGRLVGEIWVLAKAKVVLDATNAIHLELVVRSESEEAAEFVSGGLA